MESPTQTDKYIKPPPCKQYVQNQLIDSEDPLLESNFSNCNINNMPPLSFMSEQTDEYLVSNKAERFKFKEPINETFYSKRRPKIQIFKHLIETLNHRLTPDEYQLWCNLCQRDASLIEYHQSGLPMITSDIKREIAKYKLENKVPEVNEKNIKILPPNTKTKIKTNFSLSDPPQYIHLLPQLISHKHNLGFLQKKRLMKIKDTFSKFNHINSSARKFIYETSKLLGFHTKLPVKQKGNKFIKCNSVHSSNLPFLLGAKSEQIPLNEKCLTSFLLDSGSNGNLLDYNTFKNWKISNKKLKPVDVCDIKSTTSTHRNAILGEIILPIWLLRKDTSFYKCEIPFYVCNKSLELPQPILGTSFFKQVSVKLKYEDNIPAVTFNKKTDMFVTGHSNELILQNSFHTNLQVGENYVFFTLPHIFDRLSMFNTRYNITTNHADLKMVTDLYNQQQVSVSPSCQVLQSTKSAVPILIKDDAHIQLVLHSSHNMQIEPGHLSVNLSPTNSPEQKAQPTCSSSTMPSFSSTPLQNIHTNNECANRYLESTSDEQHIHKEHLQAKIKHSLSSYTEHLPTFEDMPEDQAYDVSEAVEDHLDRLSMTHTSPSHKNYEQVISAHLDETDLNFYQTLTAKYDCIAKSKSHVGKFRGFEVNLEVSEGAKAVQKRRPLHRQALTSIKKSLDPLFDAGVFIQSTGGHNKFMSNLNAVAKPTSSVRAASKADKYLDKLSNKNEKDITYRATQDLREINSVLIDSPTVALPSLTEVQDKIRGMRVSQLDIKDMYFHIPITRQSQELTNFYFGEQIVMSTRLCQGLKCSPFWAQKALAYTLHDDVLLEFLAKKKITNFPFASWENFVLAYCDDLLVYTPLHASKQIHRLCVEALLYALQRADFLISLPKCKFETTQLQFLGHEFDTIANYSKIPDLKCEAILQWREPKSFGELSSRLSSLNYFRSYLPWLKLVSIPLVELLKEKSFHWDKVHQETFECLLMLVSLQIKNFTPDPGAPFIISCDASKVAMGYCLYTLHPSGALQLITCDSKLFKISDRRKSAVQRELVCLMYTLFSLENILKNSQQRIFLLSDANSMQYLQKNRQFNSKNYEFSIFLSSFGDRLELFYCPGRSLLLCDQLSRMYQNIALENGQISQEMAQFLVPIKAKLGERISGAALTDFILESPSREYFDCWTKKYLYSQNLRKYNLNESIQKIPSESQLLAGLKIGFSHSVILNTELWKDFKSSSKSLSKSAQDEIVKQNNLQQLKNKIDCLNLKDDEILEYFEIYNKGEGDISPILSNHILTRSKAKQNNAKLSLESNNPNRGPSLTITNHDSWIKHHSSALQSFIISAISFLWPSIDEITYNQLLTLQTMKPENWDFTMFADVYFKILSIMSKLEVSMKGNVKTLMVPYNLNSSQFNIETKQNAIIIKNNELLTLNELQLLKFEVNLLFYHNGPISIHHPYDSCLIEASPTFQPLHSLKTLLLSNFSDNELQIQPGTPLLQISFDRHCPQDMCELALVEASEKDLTSVEYFYGERLTASSQDFINTLLTSSLLNQIGFTKSNNDSEKVFDQQILSDKQKKISNFMTKLDVNPSSLKKKRNSSKPVFNFDSYRKTLNKLLLTQNIYNQGNQISREVLINLQTECSHLRRIKEEILKGKHKNSFVLKSGILFKIKQKNDHNFQRQIFKLCIPRSVAETLAFNFHHKFDFHLPPKQTIQLLGSMFYCKNIPAVVHSTIANCALCTLAKAPYKRNFSGEKRSHESDIIPGQHWYVDIIHLPASTQGHKYCMVMVERLTSYIALFPLKTLKSNATATALSQFLSCMPTCDVLSADGGPEFSGHFSQTCLDNHIFLRTGAANRPQIQGSVERANSLVKSYLTKLACASGRLNWPSYLPRVCQGINQSRPYNSLFSRAQLLYSPFISQTFPLAMDGQNASANIFEQLGQYTALNNERIKNLKVKSLIGSAKIPKFKKGQICLYISPTVKTQTDGTQSLMPDSRDTVKIIEVLSGGASFRIISLLTSSEFTTSATNLRQLTIENLHCPLQLKHFQGLPDNRQRNLFRRRNHLLFFKEQDNGSYLESEISSTDEAVDKEETGEIPHDYALRSKTLSNQVKLTVPLIDDYYKLPESQQSAIRHALKMHKSLGNKLSKIEDDFVNVRSKPGIHFIANHAPLIIPSILQTSKKKVRFQESVQTASYVNNNFRIVNDKNVPLISSLTITKPLKTDLWFMVENLLTAKEVSLIKFQ